VVADIVDVVRLMASNSKVKVPHLAFQSDDLAAQNVKTVDEFQSAYYLRVEANDVVGVMTKLSAVFADHGVSIEGITQKEPQQGEESVSVIFITQKTLESRIDHVIKEIANMDDVKNDIVKIRVEHFN